MSCDGQFLTRQRRDETRQGKDLQKDVKLWREESDEDKREKRKRKRLEREGKREVDQTGDGRYTAEMTGREETRDQDQDGKKGTRR